MLGLLIHPYSPRSLTFAIEHALPKLVPVGDFVIGVGNEWYPYTTSALMRNAGPALVAVAVGLVPLIASAFYGRRWDGRVVACCRDDDGIGLRGLVSGSGLLGLRDRVETLGGRLDITSRPGEGTRLRAVVPRSDAGEASLT